MQPQAKWEKKSMYELDVNATLVGFMGFLKSRETVKIINNNNSMERGRGCKRTAPRKGTRLY